jgi:hypothetical protein
VAAARRPEALLLASPAGLELVDGLTEGDGAGDGAPQLGGDAQSG